MDGRIVELNASSFRTPPVCCSCGAPQQIQLKTTHRKGRAGGGSTTLSMDFPYCLPCHERAKSFKTKNILTIVVAAGAGVVVGGLVFAIPALPLAVAAVIAIVVGVGASVGAVLGMKPAQPPAPATARGEAARIVNFKDISRTTIYCSNPQWGDDFARANNVQARPKSKGDGFGVGAIIVGVLVAPIAAAAAWFGAHPTVYVDNPTADALNIYVDGKKEVSVGANAHMDMHIGYGKHTFGWSKADASAPVGTIEAKVQVNDSHLYNPNNTGCYWLKAAVYGSANAEGLQQGPQPIQEFYHFDKVDTWFGDNPQTIEVSNGESGGTRVALQRAAACMDLTQHGCSLDVRKSLISCERAAKSDATFDNCSKQAVVACGGGAPAAAPSAPAAQPAATHSGKPGAAPVVKPTTPAVLPPKKK